MAPTKGSARRFLTGLGTLAVMLVIGYVAFTANQGRLPGTPVTTVRAAFTDVGQLQAGSEVRQNGITIGQVSAVALVNGQPVVTMDVHGGVPMYRDGYAGIWDQSALAQKFVELRAGDPASGPLGDGTLPVSQTESTHDLVQVLDVFDPPTRAALGDALRQLGGGLAGYGPGLHGFIGTAPGVLSDVGELSTTLVSDRTDLPGLLHTSDRLSSRFTGREYQWTELLHQTDETLRALDVDNGKPLGDTVTKLPGTLRAVRTALDDADQPLTDLASATGDLRSGAHSLGRATPDVRGVFREAHAPLDRIPGVSDDAKPAVADLSRTFSDAQSLTPKLADALSSAAPPLKVLAPYAPDMGTFAFDLSNLIVNHDGWEHRLRIMAGAPSLQTLLVNQLKDTNNPYPTPGQAIRDRDPNGGEIPGR
ncbi:MAG: phospholipid/cholesterol/gamma-HCH transport system substrate-binding protein [Pseudonocardiales bacterium]|jgi:phospholipid/cholesterol/gamma-HCH transport system substrate-binding protein|nr:phospholipid/cholesterol/gamma-HCH transport system substrate-binding protein [Pseudonocardiales bacterium]